MLLEATNRDQTLSRCVHITDSLVVCVTGYEHQFANRSCTISCTLYIYIRKTLAFSRSQKTYPRGAIEPRFDRVSNFFSRFALDYYSRRFLILNERRMKDVVKKSCVLVAGYRETAFAFAISAAGVAHSVARACSMGRLLSCGCDPSSYKGKPPSKARGTQWKWGGCSHNLDYGMEFSRQFLDTRERAGDIQSTVNLHNNQAGRLVSRLINLPFHPPSPSPTLLHSLCCASCPSVRPPSLHESCDKYFIP